MSDCIKVSKSPSIRNIENRSRFCERPEPHQHPGHRSSLLYAAAGGDRERARWPSSTHSMWKRKRCLGSASDCCQHSSETPQRNTGVVVNKSGGTLLPASAFSQGSQDAGCHRVSHLSLTRVDYVSTVARVSQILQGAPRYLGYLGCTTSEVSYTAFSA